MTQKVEEKISELEALIQKIQEESNKRVSQLEVLISSLKSDLNQVKNNQQDSDSKSGSLNNEIQLAEANLSAEKKLIEALKNTLTKLNPDLETNQSILSKLEAEVNGLTAKNSELETAISEKQGEESRLTAEKGEKGEALQSLEASIDKDLESYTAQLDGVKAELQEIIDRNQVWDYLFDIIETPEVEIMAIIAAGRNISMDDIKAQAKSVSPVFVGRAITKLEADGKIVNNENLWDLSPSVIEAIK